MTQLDLVLKGEFDLPKSQLCQLFGKMSHAGFINNMRRPIMNITNRAVPRVAFKFPSFMRHTPPGAYEGTIFLLSLCLCHFSGLHLCKAVDL